MSQYPILKQTKTQKGITMRNDAVPHRGGAVHGTAAAARKALHGAAPRRCNEQKATAHAIAVPSKKTIPPIAVPSKSSLGSKLGLHKFDFATVCLGVVITPQKTATSPPGEVGGGSNLTWGAHCSQQGRGGAYTRSQCHQIAGKNNDTVAK
jgi:hypothetical protein